MSIAAPQSARSDRRLRQSERLAVGVVLERRHIAHIWQEYVWHPVAVLPSAPAVAEPRLLRQGEGWDWYHMATLELELFPRETDGYRHNLLQTRPLVYVLWRHPQEDPEGWPVPFHVTVCPYEAQDYLDGGDVVVEGVAMPETVAQWLQDFISRHPVDEPFEKRRRKAGRAVAEGDDFG
jgi:hypothetical protein